MTAGRLVLDVAGWLALRVLAEFGLILAPRHRLLAGRCFDHRDAAVHGADEHAEVAADALGLVDDGHAMAVAHLQINALVRAVPSGNVTKLAADAEVGV